MDEPRDVEAWADALLEQHRTAPSRSEAPAERGPDSSALEDAPLVVRLMTKLGGGEPDPMMLERLRRLRERQARLQAVEGAVWMAAAILMCALAYVWFSFL